MTLGFTPSIELYGANAARLNQRLISWTHIDAAGIESDQLTLTLDIEGLEGLPELGGKVGLRVGYLESGLVDRGEFIITRRTPNLFPPRLTLVATAAPFKVADATGFKQRRSASHGPTTLGALFRQLTSRHGFSPRVAPELDSIPVPHVDQSNETDMSFLTRIARPHDAVTKPLNEMYVLALRGQAKSLSGKILSPVRLSVTRDNRPGDPAFISASIDENGRAKHKGCQATWWDSAAGKERVVKLGQAPFQTLRQRYPGEGEARSAAQGAMRRIEREAIKLKLDCPGDPSLSAEGLVLLDNSWPAFMQGTWSIDKVTASGSREKNYRCMIEATCLEQQP
ncbi:MULTISPECIES: phage tail protein [Pseudomonas]|uniref:phage tail protein n=1 Tax=Pseudomonas TaxID=286 RepID=UPI0007B33D83|nr:MULTISPECIES: phage tail protein [Pseudomonas]AZC48855.1 Phage tail protein D [Pseudomonas chlororaphis subsp. piscium]AZC55474.1 Phage tail protein D [Pseudomonas chlororaphis subsp. piscium]AZC61743.1 Phage tail protein D [Pseudomonas chlororaphis subsp. piscium]AZC74170.1 Phage tail protein D [Pseudomonas chlororaphis subsp. piscium]AZC80387.1 Phage tail protein D [Pseudomonas chlororaphis subsp. piscium]